MLISYREGEDTERLVWDLAEFQDPFGIWFREGVLELHGVALSQSPLRAPAAKRSTGGVVDAGGRRADHGMLNRIGRGGRTALRKREDGVDDFTRRRAS